MWKIHGLLDYLDWTLDVSDTDLQIVSHSKTTLKWNFILCRKIFRETFYEVKNNADFKSDVRFHKFLVDFEIFAYKSSKCAFLTIFWQLYTSTKTGQRRVQKNGNVKFFYLVIYTIICFIMGNYLSVSSRESRSPCNKHFQYNFRFVLAICLPGYSADQQSYLSRPVCHTRHTVKLNSDSNHFTPSTDRYRIKIL